jgi:hypothetical protein
MIITINERVQIWLHCRKYGRDFCETINDYIKDLDRYHKKEMEEIKNG